MCVYTHAHTPKVRSKKKVNETIITLWLPLKQLCWFSWVHRIRKNELESQKLQLDLYLAWRPTTLVVICHGNWCCLTHCAAALIWLHTADTEEVDVQGKSLTSRNINTDFTKQILQEINCRISCSSPQIVWTIVGWPCYSNSTKQHQIQLNSKLL